MTLTLDGWRAVSKVLLDAVAQFDTIAASDAARQEADPDEETVDSTAVLMLFESPPPSSFHGGEARPSDSAAGAGDDLEGVSPPT